MGPDDITSDTSLFTSGGVAFGPRFTVNLQDLYSATPTLESATVQRIPLDEAIYEELLQEDTINRLREAHSSLCEAYPDQIWSYDSANHSFYGTPVMGVITSAPEPLTIASTPTGTTNLFTDMFQRYTVNELISAGGQVAEPPTSGAYFVDYSPEEVNIRPGGTPFVETTHNYRMGMQADAGNVVTAEQAQEGFDRLTRVHARNLQTELYSTDDHISYTVSNAVESAQRLECVYCVFEPDARSVAQREMLASAVDSEVTALNDNVIPNAGVMRAVFEELEPQRVYSLHDFCEADGMIHVKDQQELEALKKFIEVTNPRPYMSADNSYLYKVFNNKYTYIEQERTTDGEKHVEHTVYDRYGSYSVEGFLSLNRDEPEYKEMCELINNANGKEEDDE